MWPYWLLFSFFAVGALLQGSPQVAARPGAEAHVADRSPVATPMLILGGLLIAAMVGLRYKVGADWKTYYFYWQYAGYADLERILGMSDPAYQLLNWLAQQAGAGIWLVNLACGALFAWGLIRLAGTQPLPWLAVVAALPYLVTVVAMGYSRQAVAIGILMAGLASVFRGASLLRFAVYVLVAALFHKTAVLLMPLVIFASERNRLMSVLGGLLLFYAFYTALLANDVDQLVKSYIVTQYNSQGAAIRVGLCLVPAVLFLLSPARFGFDRLQERYWRLNSLTAVGLLVALFVVPSSTAIDRMALYVFPLQLAVLSRVPIAYPGRGSQLLVVLYALVVELVWMTQAVHARFWIPYQVYPF
ncbi:EpsG family protein [Sphingomonas sp. BN140010]|uniref:EpsG family protein n=1 Tax=Sphingomonas arvum TaxID=2992113 RepID=A0ABT3JEM2_9SPHN|nr:EpsG family protein [Sphingomonas sp. BN140010]MCW3797520.1 EpsG family protein [Sphingomonas sp. BN140010]